MNRRDHVASAESQMLRAVGNQEEHLHRAAKGREGFWKQVGYSFNFVYEKIFFLLVFFFFLIEE